MHQYRISGRPPAMNTPSGSGSEATNSPTLVARLRAPIERYSAWARGHQRSEAVDQRCSAACRYALPLIPDVVPLRFCRSDPRFANVIARAHRQVGWSIGKTVDCMIGLVSSRTCSVQRDGPFSIATWRVVETIQDLVERLPATWRSFRCSGSECCSPKVCGVQRATRWTGGWSTISIRIYGAALNSRG